jgi:ferredoxin-NADP reductase/MOSC domain-containing protein YiiM
MIAAMKLVSINVGLPREVEWGGKLVRTGIWKSAIQGRIAVRKNGLEGDGQADLVGHGGEHRALMVYQLESYRHWEFHLNRSDFAYGQFGENLTVEGLADDEACIGDRFSIGSALFEITQPRVTCYKVGIRMNEPQMPALLVAHHRPGFYFRVIKEGHIEAGDPITKVLNGPGQMTVAEIDLLLYSANHPSASLERAISIPSLSSGWRNSFKDLLKASVSGGTGNAGLVAQPVTPPAWIGFRSLRVTAVKQESEDVRSFELASKDGSPLPRFIPGQHLAVKLRPTESGPPITRMYSLCGSSSAVTFRIGIKREAMGVASRYLHENLRTGDFLETSAPRGTFLLAEATKPLILLSAGVGITPMLAMLHAATSHVSQTSREVWWIHSARNSTHYPFAKEVSELIADVETAHLTRVFSQAGEHEQRGRDYEETGHLDLAMLRRLGVPADGDFYLCGPAGYLADLCAALLAWGVPGTSVRMEAFGPSATAVGNAIGPKPHPPKELSASGPLVTFVKSGVSFHWGTQFHNLLEAAEACDVPVRWSCRSGVCHSCETGVISGELTYSPFPIDSPTPDRTLICCSTPASDLELDI